MIMIDMNSLVPENYSEIKLNVLPGESGIAMMMRLKNKLGNDWSLIASDTDYVFSRKSILIKKRFSEIEVSDTFQFAGLMLKKVSHHHAVTMTDCNKQWFTFFQHDMINVEKWTTQKSISLVNIFDALHYDHWTAPTPSNNCPLLHQLRLLRRMTPYVATNPCSEFEL
jgi:hypothetical protein